MAQLAAVSPFFIVSDLERAIAFYTDVLGFELRMSAPEDDPFFAIVARDGVQLLLKHISQEVKPSPNSSRHEWARWDAYVQTPDPDSYAAECMARSPRTELRAEDTDDGLRGSEVKDADGYVLFFGRPR